MIVPACRTSAIEPVRRERVQTGCESTFWPRPTAIIAALFVFGCQAGGAQASNAAVGTRDVITQLNAGKGDLTPLTVTFDQLHALHSGLQLTIQGDGTIQQQAVRTKAGDPKDKVTQDDLKALVALLVKHEVWTQRVDERQPVPDESRTTLRTCYSDSCLEIWEWYKQLKETGRIGEVVELMKEVALKRSGNLERVRGAPPQPVRQMSTTGEKNPKQAEAKHWFVRDDVPGGWRVAVPLAVRQPNRSDVPFLSSEVDNINGLWLEPGQSIFLAEDLAFSRLKIDTFLKEQPSRPRARPRSIRQLLHAAINHRGLL